jgi:hypothetical protein
VSFWFQQCEHAVYILTTWDAKDGFDANLLETAEEVLSDENFRHIVDL